ncbi:MAG: CatB-related O-acetyltransferase [Romboutsia sp.]
MINKNIKALEALRDGLRVQRNQLIGTKIKIDDFTYGMPVIEWADSNNLYIGKFCSIAQGVRIFLGGNHRNDWLTTYPFNSLLPEYSYIEGHPTSNGDVIIGNDVWIASNVNIMSGIKIGNGVTIAANSHVVKDVPDYAIVGGNPAKIIRYKFDNDVIKKLLEIRWWDWNIEHLSEIIPIIQSENINELFEYYNIHKEEVF